jgi:hypothetical protein
MFRLDEILITGRTLMIASVRREHSSFAVLLIEDDEGAFVGRRDDD